MKYLLILISLIFFSCISLCFAEINGNGLVCKRADIDKIVGYWFEDNAIKRFDIIGNKIELNLYANYELYGPNRITWMNDVGSRMLLDRKNLLVNNYDNCDHITSKKELLKILKNLADEESSKNIF